MSSLAFRSTAFENAVSESLYFQAIVRLKMAGQDAPHRKRDSIGVSSAGSRIFMPQQGRTDREIRFSPKVFDGSGGNGTQVVSMRLNVYETGLVRNL